MSGGTSVTLPEISVIGDPVGPAQPSVSGAFLNRPEPTFQQSIDMVNGLRRVQDLVAQTPAPPNLSSIADTRAGLDRTRDALARSRAAIDRLDTPAMPGVPPMSDPFASTGAAPIPPALPPQAGPSFDLRGPVAPPGFQGVPAEDPPGAGAAQAATAAPPNATDLALGAASSLAAGALDKAVAASDSTAGRLISRAIPFAGTALQILESTPAQAPGITPEQAASPTYADGSPRVIYDGAPVLDPSLLAEQAAPLGPPALTDGFTVPPPPASLTPPAAFTPVSGAAAAPLPGFTPAAPLPANEGLVPALPQGFGPPPGFAAMPPQGLSLPGLSPAVQTPTLPGFMAAGPSLTNGSILRSVPGPFTSNDPLVGDLANSIEKILPDRVQAVNLPLIRGDGTVITDADIMLKDGTVIQVKSGPGKGLTLQAQKTTAATGGRVIAYGPDLGGSLERGLRAAGFEVYRSPEALIEALKR